MHSAKGLLFIVTAVAAVFASGTPDVTEEKTLSFSVPQSYGEGKALQDQIARTKCRSLEAANTSAAEFSYTSIACTPLKDYSRSTHVFTTTVDANALFLLMPLMDSIAHHHADIDGHNTLIVLVSNIEHLDDLCPAFAKKYASLSVYFYIVPETTLHALFQYTPHAAGILKHVPISTMLRLLMPLLVPDDIDRLLYLDIDTIVVGSLSDVFNGRACGKPALHDFDICAKSSLRNNVLTWSTGNFRCVLERANLLDVEQFNAGVIFLSVSHMRFWGFVPFACHVSQVYGMNDQIILNLYATYSRFAPLEPVYNIFYHQDSDKYKMKDLKILHSAGPRKPWHSDTHDWAATFLGHVSAGPLYIWSSLTAPVPSYTRNVLSTTAQNSKNALVRVLCTTSECYQTIRSFELANVFVTKLQLRTFDNAESPMAPWFRMSPIVKIWSGGEYEKYLKLALELAALYHYGGTLMDWPLAQADNCLGVGWFEGPWCTEVGDFRTMYFDKNDIRLKELIQSFVSSFPYYSSDKGWSAKWFQQWSTLCPAPIDYMRAPVVVSCISNVSAALHDADKPHFGVLWMDEGSRFLLHTSDIPRVNLGDEVQGLASVQWLPFVDFEVERDNLLSKNLTGQPRKSITVFMNAWYGAANLEWPPPPSLNPVMVAVHVEPSLYRKFSSKEALSFYRSVEPIGARDSATREFFASLGVDSYLSYCMTATMQVMFAGIEKKCDLLIVDVEPKLLHGALPEALLHGACFASPKWVQQEGESVLDGKMRFTKAFELLHTYASAKVIVTSRLHTALPSASMGVPVVLVLAHSMPGGGGKKDNNQRFSGLKQLCHSVDFTVSSEKAIASLRNFDWTQPPANPGEKRLALIRCKLFKEIRAHHPGLADSISFFDLAGYTKSCR
jgi:lipopolysaccharide biosynthesis glycosyltransferase